MVGFGGAMAGLPVWVSKKRTIKKQRDGRGLGLRRPLFDDKIQQSTRSLRPRWKGCWRVGAWGLDCVGGRCLIVPGNDWKDKKINK